MTSTGTIPKVLASSPETARAKVIPETILGSPAHENGAAQEVTKPNQDTPPPTSRASRSAETMGIPPETNGRPRDGTQSKMTSADKKNGRAKDEAKTTGRRPAQTAKTKDPAASSDSPSSQHLLFTIRTLGNLLDDLERVRVMNGNRIDTMQDPERGIGVVHPALPLVQDSLKAIEHEAELELKRIWRKHPLRAWANDYPGVGEKLIARLIAEIGDPGERPNPAKLWAYCGLGDPARKRKAGMTQEEAFKLGNPKAKKVCWLIGESFVKVNKGPGRECYDAARLKYADRVHEKVCVRCGPAGKPALPGSPWSLKHQHEAAKRYAVKQFLKELWIASRQDANGTQTRVAGARS